MSQSTTDDKMIKEMEAFLAYFDNKIPSVEHEPKRFAYYVKMFRHCIQHQSKETEISHE